MDKKAILLIVLVVGMVAYLGNARYQVSAGKDNAVVKAQALVSEKFNDPQSAQFRNIRQRSGALCGEVNAKNLMGAYTGFRRFYVTTRFTGQFHEALANSRVLIEEYNDVPEFDRLYSIMCED